MKICTNVKRILYFLQYKYCVWEADWNTIYINNIHIQLSQRKINRDSYPPLKPKTILKILLNWVLTSVMKPAKSEHYTSTHRKLQCFQMRGNSDFWTCPTPNHTGMKNPWKPQVFSQKYIICSLCKNVSNFYSPSYLLNQREKTCKLVKLYMIFRVMFSGSFVS